MKNICKQSVNNRQVWPNKLLLYGRVNSLIHQRALFRALRTLKSEYTVIQAQTLCDSSQRGDATTQKHLPSDLRQPLSRTWQLRFATTAQVIRNSSNGLPLTRGGARRCPPAKPAAAPRCWDSPAKDGLYHAHCARGCEKCGVRKRLIKIESFNHKTIRRFKLDSISHNYMSAHGRDIS